MIIWSHLRMFSTWVWRCARAWIEIGHRVHELERKLLEQSELHTLEDERLQSAMASAVTAAKADRDRLHTRIDELDRTQQVRIDDWAQQLSGQINQLYMAVAASPTRQR